jgi:hypothetical protein
MTQTELDRLRKDRSNADKRKSIQKGKRLKMIRAMPLPLPSIVLRLWGTP